MKRHTPPQNFTYAPECVTKYLWAVFGRDGAGWWHIWPEIPERAIPFFHSAMVVARYDGIPHHDSNRICADCLRAVSLGPNPCDRVTVACTLARLSGER